MATKHAQISNWRNQLLPHIVDHLAKVTPAAPYSLYPNSPTTYDEGYQTVTYKDFANAINGLAWWLNDNLGPSDTIEVIAYIGPNDIRYTALLLAAIKAGYVAFFTSPRNSLAAHGALFDQLKCRTMLTPSPTPPAVEQILSALPMKHFHVPSVSDLLDKVHPHYPYNKTFETARADPFMVVHTSGSTGVPKPLIWTNETPARHSNFSANDPPPGFQSLERIHQGKRMLNTFPPFHAACIAIHLCHGVPFGTVSIAPLSGAIPSAEGVVQALKTTPAEIAFLVPSIISDLSRNPALLEYCAEHLELILYAGGDLPQAVGDIIASKMHIRCNYGASEVGLASELIAPEMTPYDWRYVRFHPEHGFDFEEITPGMFELIIKRDPRYEEHQLPFTIGPLLQKLEVYRTRDLFVKHPTIQDCWGWRARSDDIIVFLNGEKTNPVSMEHHVTASNRGVSAALVVGMQRFQAGLLVETAPELGDLSPDQVTAFIDEIWPSVEEANKITPAHARVEKSMILLTNPGKPMIRSGKGTIQRQGTVDMYATEIDDLYLRADTEFSGAEKASVDCKDPKAVSHFIKQALSKIDPGLLQEGEENFVALGMDSLMAMRLVRSLRHGLGQPDLQVSAVYNNPSVQMLTRFIVGEDIPESALNGFSNLSELESLLAEYEQRVDGISTQFLNRVENDQVPAQPRKSGEVVMLTGSTGSLGGHILRALLANPTISHIYCLNRRRDARETYEAKSKAAKSQFSKQSERVSFIHAALDEPNLGLDDRMYALLRSETTLVIHNAWTVNFMLPLKAFRTQFDGLINLFKFARSSAAPPQLFYISSISSVAQFTQLSPSSAIPEEVIREFEAPYPIGYAKSKLVSELLCDAAAQRLGIAVSFARVGQIAGPVDEETTALWNTAEWLPSLVLTSISLGALPDDLGAELNKVDWIPVDTLAEIIVELAVGLDKGPVADGVPPGANAFHLMNPSLTYWKDLLPSIVSSIEKQTNKEIKVVPMTTWLDQLQKVSEDFSASATDLSRTHPAIKLQEFYEARMLNGKHAIHWEMNRSIARSKGLQEMPAVGNDWIQRWVECWVKELGFR